MVPTTGVASHHLLQILDAIQQRYSHVPKRAIELLSEQLCVPQSEIRGVIDFYAFLHNDPRGKYTIYFSNNITDRMLGSVALRERLCSALDVRAGEPRSDGQVTVDTTSCTGICDQGPAILVNGMAVPNLDERRIDTIARLVDDGVPVDEWPESLFSIKDNLHRRDMLLSDSMAEGSAIDQAVALGSQELLSRLEVSGLRGRGGAGFNAAAKWRSCRDVEADDRYVVCNADEGEPGTFKDRILLNSFTNDLFEGMTLCARVIGSTLGFLYLRGEYRYLLPHIQHVLEDRRRRNLLGTSILGHQGFDFDIEVHLGAGAYICGEESALIESLEGKRGIPRIRPPFPNSSGYRNRPTVVNNVETFIAAAKIAAFGSDWFRAAGTRESTGTKLLSISGDCERPGVYEYPFGVTIQHILDECGAHNAEAVQVSGAAGRTYRKHEFDRTITFEDISTGGSFMIFSQDRDMLDMVENFASFFKHESCGFCTPCRVGTSLVKDLVHKVTIGHATPYDLDELRKISAVMRKDSHCGLGATASNHVRDTLEKFPEVYQRRLGNNSYEPSFDLDAALEEAREITGRDDEAAHIRGSGHE